MNAKLDISKMNKDDLNKSLLELLREQSNLRLQKSMDLLEGKNHMFRQVRRNIARVMTRLTQLNGEQK
jgi:ribosomal protein L29